MNPTLCHYCQKPCRKIFDDFTRSTHFQCDYHGSVRVRMSNALDIIQKVILVIIYREELYHATFTYNHPDPNVPKFDIVKARRPPRTHEQVLVLDFYPDLTPENIEKKLPTMILFS